MVSIITPSFGLTDSMYRNGRSKELNARHEWASSAAQKSNEYFNRSNKDRDFLSLGEPIKVGHHSEKQDRKMIEDSWNNMGKKC